MAGKNTFPDKRAPSKAPVRRAIADEATQQAVDAAAEGSRQASAASGAAGPWYTFGLGGGLLATSALAFGIVVAISYAIAAYVAWLLLWVMWVMFFGASCAAAPFGCSGSCGSSGNSGCCPCTGSASGSGSCGGSGTSSGSSTSGGKGVNALSALPAVGLAALLRRGVSPDSFAHHPEHPDFEQDVLHSFGMRWCIGCFVTWPVFLAVSGVLLLAQPIGWPVALAVGGVLACAQVASSKGWARRRSQKVAVKAAFGTGLAFAVSGVVLSPWNPATKVLALGALLVLAFVSTMPRARRMREWLAQRSL
ncbi:MAG: hypothetical protein AABX89_06325 [Candidatus Thermoplasmatota archaeon]